MTRRPSVLERLAVGYFERRYRARGSADPDDEIHFLNEDERKALRRIQHFAIARAFGAGALSAAIVAVFEITSMGHISADAEPIRYWTLLGGVTVVVSAFEIAYLYWDALRSVHELAHTAGLDLFSSDRDERRAVARALARAALELPNPPEAVFGVNPRREMSRWRLVLATVGYKAKIGFTNFVVKAFIRRAMGRAAVRAWLAFVAVPITAVWNAAVCFKVLREARIRVMGPSAAEALVGLLFEDEPPLTTLGKDTVIRAVGSSIVRTRDMHPNLEHLLVHLTRTMEVPEDEVIDQPDIFLTQLANLEAREQDMALRVLNLASMIDGRISPAEKSLILKARALCGRSEDLEVAEDLRRTFLRGDTIDREMIRRL